MEDAKKKWAWSDERAKAFQRGFQKSNPEVNVYTSLSKLLGIEQPMTEEERLKQEMLKRRQGS